MDKHSRTTTTTQGSLAVQPGGTLFNLRSVATLLMVAGAAGFFISLVVYGEQMLCLLGSTLLTFVGLGLIVMARRRMSEQVGDLAFDGQAQPTGMEFEPEPVGLAPADELSQPDALLSSFAMETFRRWGGAVTLELEREDRSVLHIQAVDGKKYVALVFERPEQVGMEDARTLYALINATGGQGGFLISDGGITGQAEEWARRRRIALVDRAWLNGAGM